MLLRVTRCGWWLPVFGRAPSTISRELARNGGRHRYRAHHADRAAVRRARRPKPSKLAENPVLRQVVEEKLGEWWSPQQVVLWLKRTYPEFCPYIW